MSENTSVDVLVVGTGAGGLLSALRAADLGLSTMVVEKSAFLGGTSAMSGGGIWIPANKSMIAQGIDDSKEDAFRYMRTLIDDRVGDDKLHTYTELANPMLEFMEAKSPIKYVAVPHYADYYPGVDGWRPGGRTMDPTPMSGAPMKDMLYKLRECPPTSKAFARVNMSILEGTEILTTAPGWLKTAMSIFAKYWLDIPGRLKGKRDRRLTQGNSLVGGLYYALRDLKVPIELNTPVLELIEEDNKITEVVLERNGKVGSIRINKGVILAAGGFEANQEMREKYLPQPSKTEWTAAHDSNTGDMITAAQNLGASVDLMEEAWWGPVVRVPGWKSAATLFQEKSKPGLIFVAKDGRRFMNEALPYNSYGEAMYGAHKAGRDNIPAYAIFDARYRKNYMFGPMLQSGFQPDWSLPKAIQKDFYVKTKTIGEMADKLGLDKAGLEETVARMNGFAESGVDEDYHRGEDDHDRFYGDPKVTPNPCLGPIDQAPYYGVLVYPGEIGTKGGLKTDCDARVLRDNGEPIAGLYAIGNCSASAMGDKYPGAGTTLGPALIFGFAAANHLGGNQG